MRKTYSDVLDGLIERANEVAAPGVVVERMPKGLAFSITYPVEDGSGWLADRTSNLLGPLLPPRMIYIDLATTMLEWLQSAMTRSRHGRVWPEDPSSETPDQAHHDDTRAASGRAQPHVHIKDHTMYMGYVLRGREVLALRPLPLPKWQL